MKSFCNDRQWELPRLKRESHLTQVDPWTLESPDPSVGIYVPSHLLSLRFRLDSYAHHGDLQAEDCSYRARDPGT